MDQLEVVFYFSLEIEMDTFQIIFSNDASSHALGEEVS